jgi:hypothetical protein
MTAAMNWSSFFSHFASPVRDCGDRRQFVWDFSLDRAGLPLPGKKGSQHSLQIVSAFVQL